MDFKKPAVVIPCYNNGRIYEEGKMIRWKNGLRPLCGIVRYTLFA